MSIVKPRFQIQKPDMSDECPLCGNPKLIKFSNCEDCKRKWGIQIQFNDLKQAIINTNYFISLTSSNNRKKF